MAGSIWFWQRIVSPHMAGLASKLAMQGMAVTYVAERLMSADRTKQGWQAPDLGAASLHLASGADTMARLVAQASADSVHICQGLRANGPILAAQRALAARGLRQWVVMETVEDAGWRGVLKRLEYCRLVHLLSDRLEGILATGYKAPDWLAARGMPVDRVFPFAYFLPDVPLPPTLTFRPELPFRILFVGQFIERKRLDLLLDALALVDSTSSYDLAVVGSGPLESQLRSRAEVQFGSRVQWIGRQSQTDIPSLMAQADCIVLPSQHDGWGAVVSEALMVGTPAVCSDRCGAAGVVRASGCGGVFQAGDAVGLAAALQVALATGRQTPVRRAALVEWAHCLGAKSGADYLFDILRHIEGDGERPTAPWEEPMGPGRIVETGPI